MLGREPVDTIFARSKLGTAHGRNAAQWSIYTERIHGAKQRRVDLDAIDPVSLYDGSHCLPRDLQDDDTLHRSFLPLLLSVADHLTQRCNLTEEAALLQLADSVVIEARRPWYTTGFHTRFAGVWLCSITRCGDDTVGRYSRRGVRRFTRSAASERRQDDD